MRNSFQHSNNQNRLESNGKMDSGSLWIKAFILSVVVGSITFIVGVVSAQTLISKNIDVAQAITGSEDKLDLDLLWKVLDLIDTHYLDRDEVDDQELVYGAVAGMVDSLGDPYTSFYTPDENVGFKDSLEGRYSGIGAQLGYKGERIVVIAPLEGSPADLAGVKAGDMIIAVDDDSTEGWGLAKAVQQIRGESGTTVVLTMADRVVEIVREEIKIPAVRLSWLSSDEAGNITSLAESSLSNLKIAHLRVLRFGSDTNAEWDKKVKELVSQGVDGVVLDVRNNPGGFLTAAIHLASEFFDRGVVVQKEGKNDLEEYSVDHKCNLCDVPVVVLINQGSASASEILAGSIQRRDRGVLVGQNSFGKGTVQESIELGDGSSVHITGARWLLPDDDNITETGLVPDILVETDQISGPFGDGVKDSQLKKAYETVLEF